MAEPRKEPPPGPTEEEERQLYLRYLAKKKERELERKKEAQAEDEKLTRNLEAAVARTLGEAANDGTGRCRWCGMELGTDGEGHRTHMPTRECPGPKPLRCGICGSEDYRWQGAPVFDWHHQCGKVRRSSEDPQLERVQGAAGSPEPHQKRLAHPDHYAGSRKPATGLQRIADIPAPVAPPPAAEPDEPAGGFFGYRGPPGGAL